MENTAQRLLDCLWSTPPALLILDGEAASPNNARQQQQQQQHELINNTRTAKIQATVVKNSDKGRFAIVLNNVLTPQECVEWLDYPKRQQHQQQHQHQQEGEEKGGGDLGDGYEPATLRGIKSSEQPYHKPEVRRSDRCIVDDKDLADELFRRIKPFLPQKFTQLQQQQQQQQQNTEGGARVEKQQLLKEQEMTRSTSYELVGINERFRFLRYEKGGFFKPHVDDSFCRDDGSGERSMLTILIYLNDGEEDFTGGRTCLVKGKKRKIYFPVTPEPGKVFVFEHNLRHAGEEVEQGVKFCVRTEAMYREVP